MKEKSTLTSLNIKKARRLLIVLTAFLDNRHIPYHLEGGTLLGIVRDKDLLPWDNDMDISIPEKYVDELKSLKYELLRKGLRLTIRVSKLNIGPFHEGDVYVFRIKPLFGYILNWFVPKFNNVVVDIFVKKNNTEFTYWQAKGKLMRVENRYYTTFQTVNFYGAELKVPNHYLDYLTQKYGDWSIPVKDWDCSQNELTIVK